MLRTAAIPVALVLATAASASPVINEFVARPGAEEGEWVELHNPEAAPLDLGGWTLEDGTGKRRVLAGPARVPPRGFLVLAARPESLRVHYALAGSVAVVRPGGWPVLNDRDGSGGAPADVLVLRDPAGVVVDSLAYFESWQAPEGGRSVERIAAELPTTDGGSWGWSVDPAGATPGRGNSLTRSPHPPDRGAFVVPPVADPARGDAVLEYALPGPGTLAIWLLDREGAEVAVLRAPGPAPAAGRWSWGPESPRPVRPGFYFLCLRWQGADAAVLEQCRSVWVRL
jgi:hypothetical protein